MLAVRYHGVEDIRLENLPRPEPEENQALVRIAYAGICGSDLHIYNKGMFMKDPPRIMGHEFSGTIEKVGSGVKNLVPGQKVTGDPRVFCGHCGWCLAGKENLCPDLGFIGEVAPGSFAEFMALDADHLLAVPEEVDLLRAAMAEPLAVALCIAERGCFAEAGSVGITGAGPIGLLTALLAGQVYKVPRVALVDISEKRLEPARRLGLTELHTAIPPSLNVETAVEASGAGAALEKVMEWTAAEGKVVIAGIFEERVTFDPNAIVAKELRVSGIHGYRKEDIGKALTMLANKAIDPAPIATVLPLAEAAQGFEMLLGEERQAVKILLTP